MPTKTNQDGDPMYTGKDYEIRFTEVDGEDLSSFDEVTYAFAKSSGSDSAEFTKTMSGGDISTADDDSDGDNEVAEVSIDGADTAGLAAPTTYYHELVTDDGNKEQVAATGRPTLLPSVTDN